MVDRFSSKYGFIACMFQTIHDVLYAAIIVQ